MFNIIHTKKAYEEVAKIEKVCFGHLLCEETDDFWLIYEGKSIAGYCANRYYTNPFVCFMSGCGILPDYRGNGLQKRAIRVREQAAKKLGYNRIVTYTLKDNIWSANNFIRSGYKLYIPKYFYGSPNSLYFYKEFNDGR